jgi:hypothetical protein
MSCEDMDNVKVTMQISPSIRDFSTHWVVKGFSHLGRIEII